MDKRKRSYGSMEKMLPLLEDYHASGLSQKQYCEREQLAPHLLGYWLRKYKAQQSDDQEIRAPKFVELAISSPLPTLDGVEIVYSNGTKINIVQKVDWAFFEKLLVKLDDVSNHG